MPFYECSDRNMVPLYIFEDELERGKTVCETDLEDFRNLVMLVALINTPSRSDVLTNMSMAHVENARLDVGMYVIKVSISSFDGQFHCMKTSHLLTLCYSNSRKNM